MDQERLIENEQIDYKTLYGSWACAFGNFQFMPTTIKNYAIDSLIEKLINAKNRQELITITNALDRVLLWHHYVIPNWHISSYRVLYWDFFDQPNIKPKYSLGFDTWWLNQKKYDLIQSKRTSN